MSVGLEGPAAAVEEEAVAAFFLFFLEDEATSVLADEPDAEALAFSASACFLIVAGRTRFLPWLHRRRLASAVRLDTFCNSIEQLLLAWETAVDRTAILVEKLHFDTSRILPVLRMRLVWLLHIFELQYVRRLWRARVG